MIGDVNLWDLCYWMTLITTCMSIINISSPRLRKYARIEPHIMPSGASWMCLNGTIEEVYKEVKKIRADMVRREDLEALADTTRDPE